MKDSGEEFKDYKELPLNQLQPILGTDPTVGLSQESAAAKLAKYGP
ncbi:MAG: hypothetical protein JRN20_22840, partial [Nitrososphaerota archaeon]|nr:hypothetical protein [Nitrososphaerota archaeon]